MNYEQELNNLRNAQKNAAMADLQATRDTSLSNLQAEETRIRPEYAAQRNTLNANNRVAARNFQEYLANTGRANSGIGAQYEMGRQNSLQRGLSALNTAEAQNLADIARRRSDIQNAYNSGLASANANVEANYINNLLAQRQQQWERDFAQKQFDESVRQYNQTRLDNLNKAFSSGGNSRRTTSGGKKTSKKTATEEAVEEVLENGDYNVKSISSPATFSSTNARKWYDANANNVKTKSQLDTVIASGLKSGKISQKDADKIYKAYGIN